MTPKFRAWHKPTQLMDDVVLIDFYNEKIGILYADPFVQGESIQKYNFNEMELMQSTGLQDKNGKDIFEGDIVRWKDLESFDDFPIDEVFKVEYSDEFMKWIACYKNNLQYKSDLYDFTDNRDLEVVGNIYENPELLEVKE